MKTRNGKIARLDPALRQELNSRLECSEPGSQLLAWLNQLPAVRTILQQEFDGEPINKQNLSQWRQGGFQEWLARRQVWEDVKDLDGFADQVENSGDGLVADNVATMLAARYASLLARWDGEADGPFMAKAKALALVTRSVLQLQRTPSICPGGPPIETAPDRRKSDEKEGQGTQNTVKRIQPAKTKHSNAKKLRKPLKAKSIHSNSSPPTRPTESKQVKVSQSDESPLSEPSPPASLEAPGPINTA